MDPGLREATFLVRPNRFVALVRLDGEEVETHVANTGRMKELFVPGTPVFVTPAPANGARRTAYDLTLVEVDRVLVSADARLPNSLLKEAIEHERLPEFRGYSHVRREVMLEESRVDLELSGAPPLCYIEAKSVTLVEDGVGLFPDAPTVRGRKHLKSLEKAVGAGHRAAVAFVIQRPDARSMAPNDAADGEFSEALRQAVANGVEAYAYTCQVSRTCVEISHPVPVNL